MQFLPGLILSYDNRLSPRENNIFHITAATNTYRNTDIKDRGNVMAHRAVMSM